MDLDYIFRPKSVAVIGASSESGKIGYLILNNMVNDGYSGKIFPVNPKACDIFGLKSYPSVSAVEAKVDMAVIVVPAKAVPQVMEECGKKGIRGAVIISSGFSEAGEEGRRLEQEVLATARKYGMRIIGPNCLGIVSTPARLNASFGMSVKQSGPISFVSQSGAFADGVLGWAQDAGIGFSKFVSIGNKSDLDDADLLEYLAGDKETKSIALYIEGLKDGRKFFETAKKVSSAKPIVVLKSGKSVSGTRAALSHTGSLAGSDNLYDAAFKQAGVIRANDVEELFDMAKSLAYQNPAPGKRIAILTNAGGLGVMCADTCEQYGLLIPEPSAETKTKLKGHMPSFGSPRNPVDITAQGSPEQQAEMYSACMQILLEDESFDGLIVISEGNYPWKFVELFTESLIETYERLKPEKPVIVCWMASNIIDKQLREIEKHGLPTYSIPERASRAMHALVRYGTVKRKIRAEA